MRIYSFISLSYLTEIHWKWQPIPVFYMWNLCCNSTGSITRAGTHQGKQTCDFPQRTFWFLCEQSFKLQSAHTATQRVDFSTKEDPLWNVNSMKKATNMSTTWGASWANEIPAVYHVTSCMKLLLWHWNHTSSLFSLQTEKHSETISLFMIMEVNSDFQNYQ